MCSGSAARPVGSMARALVMLLLCLASRSDALLPREINVLGLFDSGSSGDLQAFESAIDEINDNYDCLHGSKLVGKAVHIYPGDSFKAAKEVCEVLETVGAAAVIGPQVSPTTSRHVQSLCHSLQVPHLEGRWSYPALTSWGTRQPYSVNFYPAPEYLSEAYIALIREWNTKKIVVIYEDNDGLIRLQKILTHIHEPKVHLAQLPDDQDYRPFLKMIKRTLIRHVVIDCRPELIRVIMDQAEQIKLVNEYHSFLFTSLDLHTVDFTPYQREQGRVNITGFRLLRDAGTRLGNPADSCVRDEEWRTPTHQLTTTGALMYDALHALARALRESERDGPIIVPTLSCDANIGWGMGPDGNGTYIINRILGLQMVSPAPRPLVGRSGLIRLNSIGRRDEFDLDVLELGNTGMEVVGTWSRHGGVNYTRTWGQKKLQIATSMAGRTFKVVVGTADPYVRPQNITGKPFEGFCIDLMDLIAERQNFSVEYHMVENNNYGTINDKGVPNGMMKELMENTADMAIADLSITLERERGVDFSMPWMNLGISILYKKPVKAPPQLFSFMGPLSAEVWIYMGTAYLGVSVLLFILARLSPQEWNEPGVCSMAGADPDFLENEMNLRNSFWFTIGSLMQQGCDINPKAVSTRMVAAWWWVFTLIMISSYTANLAAFLTAGRMDTPIKSAEDLAKQTTIKYGAKETGSTKLFFRDSSKELYRRMYNFMESARPSVYVASSEDGVRRVKESQYAYLMESTGIEYVLERNCDLTQIGGLLDHKSYGIALPPGSPYTSIINSAILHLQEQGRLLELKNRWWKTNNTCPDDSKVNANELGIDNVGGVFVVLLGGMCVAVLIAFGEFIWKSRKLAHAEHTSLMNEMAKELKFAFSCKGSSKPVSKPEPLRPSQSATYLANGPGPWNADVTFEPYQRKP